MSDPALDSARREAAQWVARRADGFDPATDRDFQRWLAADPRHAATWSEADATWTALQRSRAGGEAALLRERIDVLRTRHRTRRRRIVFSTGLAAAAALAVAFILPGRNPSPAPTLASTIVVRPHVQTLADGSRVELNAGAEVAVDFTPERRAVRLLRGEALFTVAKNPARPFVVTAGSVEVRAVGTEFNVRLGSAAVEVIVTEGRVGVTPVAAPEASPAVPPPIAPAVFVDAGAQTRVRADATPPEVIPLTPAALTQALAWRERRVEFAETPLEDALRWFNRQNAVQLSVATPSLARRRISGVYWTDDPEGFARLVSSSLGLGAERNGDTIVFAAK